MPIRNAIETAKMQISQICSRRACLDACLRRLDDVARRGGGGCACVPAPSASRLVSFCRSILRRFRRAALLVSLLLVGISAHCEVVCIWQNGGWTCSGDGDYIHVGAGESWYQEAVTNLVGVCTNCSAIAPNSLLSLGQSVKSIADNIDGISSLVNNYTSNIKSYTQGLINDADECITLPDTGQHSLVLSNFWFNSQTAQAVAVRSGVSYTYGTTNGRRIIGGAANAVKAYADATKPSLQNVLDECNNLEMGVSDQTYQQSSMLRRIGDELIAGAQPCIDANDWNGPTNANDSSTGKWCTEEQGDAIIEALNDLKKHAENQLNHLKALSNFVWNIEQTVYHGFFSSYTHIPKGDQLGGTWKEVYFTDAPTPEWGYEPTNVLQRIELILYGMAGLSTNEYEEAEQHADSLDRSTDSMTNSISRFADMSTNDLISVQSSVESLGDAIKDLLDSLTPGTADYRGSETFIEDTTFQFGQSNYTIPGLRLPVPGRSASLQTILNAIRAAATIVYLLLAAFAIFTFWTAFAKYAIQFSKWATDALTSMFSA